MDSSGLCESILKVGTVYYYQINKLTKYQEKLILVLVITVTAILKLRGALILRVVFFFFQKSFGWIFPRSPQPMEILRVLVLRPSENTLPRQLSIRILIKKCNA